MFFKLAILAFAMMHSGVCAFFDLTDIDDPLSLLWHTKDPFHHNNDKPCQTTSPDGTIIPGLCKPPSNCLLSGGQLHGHCGLLSTCCTYERTCSRTTKSKVSHFSSTNSLDTGNAWIPTSCEYNVQIRNKNICQIRLDFEVFRLSPASLIVNDYKCATDSLVISPNAYGIPELCGNNDNQHVYVHLNRVNNVNQVNLKISLQNRTNVVGLVTPEWRIKVTQLECPRHSSLLQFGGSKMLVQDYNMLAPEGAIQYYMKNTGFVKSFGFDSDLKKNSYTSGQRYAIAFQTSQTVCGVIFTSVYANMRITEGATSPYTDADCTDYLFVPELDWTITDDYAFMSKVCLAGTNVKFISKPPGPLYIHFVSADETDDGALNTGVYAFNIKYDLLTSC